MSAAVDDGNGNGSNDDDHDDDVDEQARGGDVLVVEMEEDEDEVEDEEDEDDPLAHLPGYVLERVDALLALDARRQRTMELYAKERAELESKYAALLEPMYRERSEIVRGNRDDEIRRSSATKQKRKEEEERPADDDDDAAGEEGGAEPNEEIGNDDEATTQPQGEGQQRQIISVGAEGSSSQQQQHPEVKGVPQFWVSAMTHNETVGELITEDDVDCLEYLLDVSCVDRPDGKGFALRFRFAPNEYFNNDVLTKTYDVPNLMLSSDEPLLKGVRGTKVDWKSDDRALTYRMVKKKQRGKGKNAGQVRTVTKKEDVESFFRWFEPPEMPEMDTIEDESEAERLEAIFDDDYEVAAAFRCQIVPRAVLWFTNQAEDEQLASALADGEAGEAEDEEQGEG